MHKLFIYLFINLSVSFFFNAKNKSSANDLTFFSAHGCSYAFDINSYVWSFADTKCGRLLSKFEFYFHISLFIAIISVDITTFHKLVAKKIFEVIMKPFFQKFPK